jgi:hypothetical protein
MHRHQGGGLPAWQLHGRWDQYTLLTTTYCVSEHAEGVHVALAAHSLKRTQQGRIRSAPCGCKHWGEPWCASTFKVSMENDIHLALNITTVRPHLSFISSVGRGTLLGNWEIAYTITKVCRFACSPPKGGGGLIGAGTPGNNPQLSSAQIFDYYSINGTYKVH